jgi:threonine/homoserine/homoserine lactone efflux protein
MSYVLRGLMLGLSIAAPVGPVALLCMRRTLAQGRLHGFVSGLGAASADLIYGAIAALGLTSLSGFLVAQQSWVRLVGGLFLVYLGVRTLTSKPASRAAAARPGGLLVSYASTLLLTLTNPITILSFVAVFAGLGLATPMATYAAAGLLVLGVFLGSALWWLVLSMMVGSLRSRSTPRAMLWVNRLSGLAILGFGFYALSGMLQL